MTPEIMDSRATATIAVAILSILIGYGTAASGYFCIFKGSFGDQHHSQGGKKKKPVGVICWHLNTELRRSETQQMLFGLICILSATLTSGSKNASRLVNVTKK